MREPSQHAEENGAHGKYSVCVCRRCIHAFGAFVRPTRHTRSFYRDAGLRGPPQRCLPHRISQAQSAAVFRLMPPKHETVEGNRGCVHGPWQYRIPLNATHAATASNPPSTRLCIYIYISTETVQNHMAWRHRMPNFVTPCATNSIQQCRAQQHDKRNPATRCATEQCNTKPRGHRQSSRHPAACLLYRRMLFVSQ